MDMAVTHGRVPFESGRKGGKGYADQEHTHVVLLVPAKIDLKSYLNRLNHLEQEVPSFFPAYARLHIQHLRSRDKRTNIQITNRTTQSH